MAAIAGLKAEQLVLEVSECEVIHNTQTFVARANLCRALGVRFAIDDFGAGFSGLNLLAEFQPEQLKLDLLLVRDVHRKGPRQAITRGVLRTCEDLGIEVVAEGVESLDEYRWLSDEGIHLFQGYLFAKPALERLPEVLYPA
jgi:EAL domain-containing protein (putative c-di-GMP-specific phosphodiesterase class I)